MKYAEAVVKAVSTYKNIPYDKSSKSDTYTVLKGDTLWSIAKKFNTTVDNLKKANKLNGNMLYIGQNLVVPEYFTTEDTNITYIVKKGDTLYSIATLYGVSINDLKNSNNLSSDILSIGQEIKIPSGESIITPSEDDIINEDNTYIVQRGDTLYSISRKFNIPINDIKINNNLTSDILKVGEVLKIPTSNISINDIEIYKVKPGDSLYSLSKLYNTTIEDIKQLNNLTSDILKIGQELQIKKNTNM